MRAKKHLEKLGYEVIVAEHAAGNEGYVSADATKRVSDLHAAFSDKKCSLVLCSIGGNHANQLLDKIDYELIARNPKAFCGYSDITVLHCAFLAKTGLQTFYGPTFLNQFGEHPEVLGFTDRSFRRVLMGEANIKEETMSTAYTDEILDWFTDEDATRPRKLTGHSGIQVWKAGVTTGRAFPFTVPSINHLLNTEYLSVVESPILMVDIPEGASMHEGLSVGEFDAWFTDVILSGMLDNAAGLVFGRAYKYDAEKIAALQAMILKRCADYDFPILYGADFGHTDPQFTIPYGSVWAVDTSAEYPLRFVRSV
jgi:muramoyltetrapeptide carboxypeptidase